MSFSKRTPNFNLPVATQNDTISFIPDWNDLAQKVDSQMQLNKALGTSNELDIQSIREDMATIESKLNDIDGLFLKRIVAKMSTGVNTSVGNVRLQYLTPEKNCLIAGLFCTINTEMMGQRKPNYYQLCTFPWPDTVLSFDSNSGCYVIDGHIGNVNLYISNGTASLEIFSTSSINGSIYVSVV